MNLFRYLLIFFSISNFSLAYSPKIFAHRGGGKEYPENTIIAFEEALKKGADGIELDVQLTKDKNVVLYHSRELSHKKISELTFNDIHKINPSILALKEVIDKFPNMEIVVDLKSLPVEDLIDAIVKLVDKKNVWDRLIFYSTNDEHIDYFKKKKPDAKFFENRKLTRERLLKMRNESSCCCEDKQTQYAGFELSREMEVCEAFALGKSTSKINFKLWDSKSIGCFNNSLQNPAKIFIFGVNNKEDYQEAKRLGAYAVYTDTPGGLISSLKVKSLD